MNPETMEAFNLPTLAVAAVLAGIVALILRKMIRDRRAGKNSCGCGGGKCGGSCASCPLGAIEAELKSRRPGGPDNNPSKMNP